MPILLANANWQRNVRAVLLFS